LLTDADERTVQSCNATVTGQSQPRDLFSRRKQYSLIKFILMIKVTSKIYFQLH